VIKVTKKLSLEKKSHSECEGEQCWIFFLDLRPKVKSIENPRDKI